MSDGKAQPFSVQFHLKIVLLKRKKNILRNLLRVSIKHTCRKFNIDSAANEAAATAFPE